MLGNKFLWLFCGCQFVTVTIAFKCFPRVDAGVSLNMIVAVAAGVVLTKTVAHFAKITPS